MQQGNSGPVSSYLVSGGAQGQQSESGEEVGKRTCRQVVTAGEKVAGVMCEIRVSARAEREGVASSGVWRAIKTFRVRTGSGGRRSARSWRAGGLQEELRGGALV